MAEEKINKCFYCGEEVYQKFLIEGEEEWLCENCTNNKLDEVEDDRNKS